MVCVHGTEDTHSLVESSRFLARELARAGKGNVVFKEYPGLGHGLSDPAWAEILDMLFPGFR
jgi:dipeptidyl aminopeptidase/acylaminoacyl peptidase